MARLLLISLLAGTACGPSISSSPSGGADEGGTGPDAEPDSGAETGDSTGEEVVEPELVCSRGDRVGCLAVEPGEPDLCLCRGQTIDVVRPQGYTDWQASEIMTPDGEALLAIVGGNSRSEAGYSMSTWRAVGDRLELVESAARDNYDRYWLVGAVVPELGSAHVAAGGDSGAAWVIQSMPEAADLKPPYIGPREDMGSFPLVHMGDFDADGLVDLLLIDVDRLDASAVSDFEPNSDAVRVRCVDLDQDGRRDLLVSIDLWPDDGHAVDVHYQRADRSIAPPVRMPLLSIGGSRGVRAARLFGNDRASSGLDLFNLQAGRLYLQQALGPRAYSPPRFGELSEDLNVLGHFDIDGDGRDELIGQVSWPYKPESDDPGEELMVLWGETS